MLIDDGKREQTRADGMVPLENGLLSIFSIWGRGEEGDRIKYVQVIWVERHIDELEFDNGYSLG